MIDFHSHILPNIDDGSTSMLETINLIKEARQVGFTDIIATPHYIQGYYEADCYERNGLLELIKKEIGKGVDFSDSNLQLKEPSLFMQEPSPSLHLGNEIYITPEILELIENGQASTINNTKYVLFELPMNSKPLFVKDVIYKLMENGYSPIIAHPERYSYVQENREYIHELVNMGALLQANYGSVIGMYGSKAQKTLKDLLKDDLISFFGSDAHRCNHIYTKIPKILKKLEKIVSKQKLYELTTLNASNVLKNI